MFLRGCKRADKKKIALRQPIPGSRGGDIGGRRLQFVTVDAGIHHAYLICSCAVEAAQVVGRGLAVRQYKVSPRLAVASSCFQVSPLQRRMRGREVLEAQIVHGGNCAAGKNRGQRVSWHEGDIRTRPPERSREAEMRPHTREGNHDLLRVCRANQRRDRRADCRAGKARIRLGSLAAFVGCAQGPVSAGANNTQCPWAVRKYCGWRQSRCERAISRLSLGPGASFPGGRVKAQ